MRKIFLFINTVCLLTLVACSSSESESKDKKDSSEVKDSTETNEETVEQSAKKKLLTSMIGKHKLISIDGLTGANTFFSFAGKDGVWKGEASTNEGGERDGYDLEISESDLAKLNSMCIVVSEDLTVTLEVNGKTYCKIPFDEKLKDLKLAPTNEHLKYDDNLPKLTEDNNVINSWHYLLVRDDIADAKMRELEVSEIILSDLIIIKVSEEINEFNVEMRTDVCCDQATYVFGK